MLTSWFDQATFRKRMTQTCSVAEGNAKSSSLMLKRMMMCTQGKMKFCGQRWFLFTIMIISPFPRNRGKEKAPEFHLSISIVSRHCQTSSRCILDTHCPSHLLICIKFQQFWPDLKANELIWCNQPRESSCKRSKKIDRWQRLVLHCCQLHRTHPHRMATSHQLQSLQGLRGTTRQWLPSSDLNCDHQDAHYGVHKHKIQDHHLSPAVCEEFIKSKERDQLTNTQECGRIVLLLLPLKNRTRSMHA